MKLARLLLLILAIIATSAVAQPSSRIPISVIEVVSGDQEGLIDAVLEANRSEGLVEIRVVPDRTGARPPFRFGVPFGQSGSALPAITGEIRISSGRLAGEPVVFVGDDARQPVRLAEVVERGVLMLERVQASGFGSVEDGGLIRVDRLARLRMDECTIVGNHADGSGGAVAAAGNAEAILNRCRLFENSAGAAGGVVAASGAAFVKISDSVLAGNAAPEGCAVFIDAISSQRRLDAVINNVTLNGQGCSSSLVVNAVGTLVLHGNTFINAENPVESSGIVRLFGNIFGGQVAAAKMIAKDSCEGDGEYLSDGYNISIDDSCMLTDETDQPDTDPEVDTPTEDGTVPVKPGSPAVDAGASELSAAIAANLATALPCGYKDSRDLGRPQDANGDGIFECDIGDFEIQGGPDIGAAQSGAFFDPSRNGEGVFLEILEGDQALAAMFTYLPDGDGLAWFIGLGAVVGNSVVIDDFLVTSGGVFGSDFDPDAVDRTRVGGMSMIFPSCEGVAMPGKLSFQADEDGEFGDLLVDSTRLTGILDCDMPGSNTDAGRSGSFFAPERDGEGIFVQWLPSGQVVVIWYTYDPDGNQFWTISGSATVDGNRVTAQMLYPAQPTGFGDAFDPAEIMLEPWGTVVLEYADCDTMTFNFDSEVPGFGSGSYDYVRLTNLAGADCDL